MRDDYDIADDQAYNFVSRSLREQPLMEAFAWHGWSGPWEGEGGWMTLVAGPTRHAAEPELQGMTHRWSWPYQPSQEEQERRLGEESVEPAGQPSQDDDDHPDTERTTES